VKYLGEKTNSTDISDTHTQLPVNYTEDVKICCSLGLLGTLPLIWDWKFVPKRR